MINKRKEESNDEVDSTSIINNNSDNSNKRVCHREENVFEDDDSSLVDYEEEIIDLAKMFGYKPGQRFEVEWHVSSKENEGDSKWWGCELLPRSSSNNNEDEEDGVVVRNLLYDPKPEWGFPEPSKEEVVFIGENALLTKEQQIESTDNDKNQLKQSKWVLDNEDVRQLRYRLDSKASGEESKASGEENNSATAITNEGNNDDEIVRCNDDELTRHLNDALLKAVEKNKHTWGSLPASRRAEIAETMSRGREKLVKALRDGFGGNNSVITAADVREVLSRTF